MVTLAVSRVCACLRVCAPRLHSKVLPVWNIVFVNTNTCIVFESSKLSQNPEKCSYVLSGSPLIQAQPGYCPAACW